MSGRTSPTIRSSTEGSRKNALSAGDMASTAAQISRSSSRSRTAATNSCTEPKPSRRATGPNRFSNR